MEIKAKDTKTHKFRWDQVVSFRVGRDDTEFGDDFCFCDQMIPKKPEVSLAGQEQRDKLEQISIELEKATSILGFVGDHFGKTSPTPTELMYRYKMYSSAFDFAFDTICEQKEALVRYTESFGASQNNV